MELLIRVVDKAGAPAGPHGFKAGMVIAARPDNWPWSAAELSSVDWVIIRTPITQIEADALVTAPLDNATSNATSTTRIYKINVTGISHRPNVTIIDMPAAIFRTLQSQIT